MFRETSPGPITLGPLGPLGPLVALAAAAALAACGGDGGPSQGTVTPGGVTIDLSGCPAAQYTESVTACVPAATDYQPRKGVPAANGWPTCVSDDNAFHLIGDGIPPAAARSAAFEAMGPLLWRNPNPPSKAEFLAARDDYSVTEGLASRIARRQDVHYAEVPGDDKFACAQAGIPAQYPDRCAGPAKLKPLIDDAFVKGAAQTQPRVQAARIEAALLWFFYLSMTSEVWTCGFDDITDCDAAAGYYTQISVRASPLGLGRYVAAIGQETHDRVYDGLLAERCWRDLDKAMPAVSATKYYQLAQAQLDKATLRGEALILRQRIGLVGCASGEYQLAQLEFVKVLGGLLDHGAGLRDAANAAKLKAYTANPTTDASAIAAAQAAIDAIFGCP